MKNVLLFVLLVCVGIVGSFVLGLGGQRQTVDETMLPWRVAVDAEGSTVLGLHPGRSTLGDVRERLGTDLEVAIIAAPGEAGSLEAYYSQVTLGFVQARVILAVDAPPALISAMRERSPKAEYMESATRKIALIAADREAAWRLPVTSISVIPGVNLDEAAVIQRFGPPGERLVVSDKRVHLLYPQFGLDVIVDQQGKELFQYVAPARFSLLREPLLRQVDGGEQR